MLPLLAALVAHACYPGDDQRHALGVVIMGGSEADVAAGKDMLELASAVTISEFNIQLVLVGEVVDPSVKTISCMDGTNVNEGLLLNTRESFGGIHVHMVSHCSEPAKNGGFVKQSDRSCAGHTALYVGRSDYITLLHEIGHLLSAQHPGNVATPVCSVGGIMDYCKGDPHPYGTYDGKVQFHPEQKANICKHIAEESQCVYDPAEIVPHTVVEHSHSHAYLYLAAGCAAFLVLLAMLYVLYFGSSEASLL